MFSTMRSVRMPHIYNAQRVRAPRSTVYVRTWIRPLVSHWLTHEQPRTTAIQPSLSSESLPYAAAA